MLPSNLKQLLLVLWELLTGHANLEDEISAHIAYFQFDKSADPDYTISIIQGTSSHVKVNNLTFTDEIVIVHQDVCSFF